MKGGGGGGGELRVEGGGGKVRDGWRGNVERLRKILE